MSHIKEIAKNYFNIEVKESKELGGYDCKNYLINTPDNQRFVLKHHLEKDILSVLQTESELLDHLSTTYQGHYQKPILSNNSKFVEEIDGEAYRLVQYLEGDLLANVQINEKICLSFGEELALLHEGLKGKRSDDIEARKRYWDLQYFEISAAYRPYLSKDLNGKLVDYFIQQYNLRFRDQLHSLPKGLIHGDANDYNVLANSKEITAIIDLGDITYAPYILDIAISLVYVIMEQDDPIALTQAFLKGYQKARKLSKEEIDFLYYLIPLRCCQSILNAAYSVHQQPENKEYIEISQKGIWQLLEEWIKINPIHFTQSCYDALELPYEKFNAKHLEEDQAKRDQLLSKALSINPIHMDSAAFQYMYSLDGKTYLDLRNNIPHVGHCHPKVTKAGIDQMIKMNTNTRYYYDALHEYGELLLSKFPEKLNRIFFVNSGSAASDLAFRLATTCSGKDKIMGMEEGYHGNTFKAIQVSHYKYSHAGGFEQKGDILKAPMPWNWQHTLGNTAGEQLANQAESIINDNKGEIAGFVAEPIIGCGGQLELPKDYFEKVYPMIKAQGGYCIADEVQTGFGRTGDYWWGFEHYGITPDIIITGKCIGNGHPMAAVICTEEIAEKFNNGMEFFSSFGGNPVSCEIGKAVLEVIDEEHLMNNVKEVSSYFFDELKRLENTYPTVGSARGKGFFIGFELVNNKEEYIANPELCAAIKKHCKDNLILLGSDGPFDNVLKMKPPLCFTKENVNEVIAVIEETLQKWA